MKCAALGRVARIVFGKKRSDGVGHRGRRMCAAEQYADLWVGGCWILNSMD
jgi:hypothetical protein